MGPVEFWTSCPDWTLSVSRASAGTGVLWWLYIDHRLYGNDTMAKMTKEVKEEKEEAGSDRDGGQALLVYAAAATVFTVGAQLWSRDCLGGGTGS